MSPPPPTTGTLDDGGSPRGRSRVSVPTGPRRGATPRYYFLHIPKTAGTSVTASLRELLGDPGARMLGPCLLDDLLRPAYSGWEHADLLAGHLTRMPLERHRGFRGLTVLRDPRTHLFSWFRHVRREPGHFLHRTVVDEGWTFERWLEDPRSRTLVDNPQARHLALSGQIGDREFDPRDPTAVQRRFDLTPRTCDDDELHERASATLSSIRIAGTFEDLAGFIRAVSIDCGRPPVPLALENVDLGAPVGHPPLGDRVDELCAVDVALHRWIASRSLPHQADRPEGSTRSTTDLRTDRLV